MNTFDALLLPKKEDRVITLRITKSNQALGSIKESTSAKTTETSERHQTDRQD